jgi:hypothetical protein
MQGDAVFGYRLGVWPMLCGACFDLSLAPLMSILRDSTVLQVIFSGALAHRLSDSFGALCEVHEFTM